MDSLRDYIIDNWPVSTDRIREHLMRLKRLGHLPQALPQTPVELREQLDTMANAKAISGDDEGWGPPTPVRKKRAELLFDR